MGSASRTAVSFDVNYSNAAWLRVIDIKTHNGLYNLELTPTIVINNIGNIQFTYISCGRC